MRKNIIERTITASLKTEMIEREWKTSAEKFIFEGKTYLAPIMEGVEILSLIALTTELE